MIRSSRMKMLPGLRIGYRRVPEGLFEMYLLVNVEGDAKIIYLDDVQAPIEFIPRDNPKVIDNTLPFEDMYGNILESKIMGLLQQRDDIVAIRVQTLGDIKRLLIWGDNTSFSDGEILEEEFEEYTDVNIFS